MSDRNAGRDPVFAELDRLIAESDIRTDRDFASPELPPAPLPVSIPSRHISDWKQRRWKYLRETGRTCPLTIWTLYVKNRSAAVNVLCHIN